MIGGLLRDVTDKNTILKKKKHFKQFCTLHKNHGSPKKTNNFSHNYIILSI